jgi:hypothetical protein
MSKVAPAFRLMRLYPFTGVQSGLSFFILLIIVCLVFNLWQSWTCLHLRGALAGHTCVRIGGLASVIDRCRPEARRKPRQRRQVSH